MKSALAIAFDYRPCRWVAAGTLLIGTLAVLGILVCDLAPWLRLLLAASVLVYALFATQRFLRDPLRRIACVDGAWLLCRHDGAEEVVSLRSSVRRGALLVLEFVKEGGGVRRVVLTPDNLDADLRRRLILLLAAT
jgi:hypothetical protein